MADLFEIQFFLLVSLLLLSARALEVSLANFNGVFRIHVELHRGRSHERIDVSPFENRAVLYIVTPRQFEKIMQPEFSDRRNETQYYLHFQGYCLLFMAIKDSKWYLDELDKSAIREFIFEAIRPSPELWPWQSPFQFETIGNINLEATVQTTEMEKIFSKCGEVWYAFGRDLQEYLEEIFPARDLYVSLANFNGSFKIRADVHSVEAIEISNLNTHFGSMGVVILYIVTPNRFTDIMRTELYAVREKIEKQLHHKGNAELIFMAIEDFEENLDEKDKSAIRKFISNTIKPFPSMSPLEFKTIGHISLQQTDQSRSETLFSKYTNKRLEKRLEAMKIEKK